MVTLSPSIPRPLALTSNAQNEVKNASCERAVACPVPKAVFLELPIEGPRDEPRMAKHTQRTSITKETDQPVPDGVVCDVG